MATAAPETASHRFKWTFIPPTVPVVCPDPVGGSSWLCHSVFQLVEKDLVVSGDGVLRLRPLGRDVAAERAALGEEPLVGDQRAAGVAAGELDREPVLDAGGQLRLEHDRRGERVVR